jgi:hypothetical protein
VDFYALALALALALCSLPKGMKLYLGNDFLRYTKLLRLQYLKRNQMEDKRILLAKIFPEQYRKSFLNGDLYLNTPMYLKKLESGDIVRNDPDEGLSESRQFIELAVRVVIGLKALLPTSK